MKYLSIDYGLKRTGIAVSDNEGKFAFPLATIIMKGKDAFFEELFSFSNAEKIEAYVVGLPLYLDGTESETTRIVRNFSARLNRRTPLPVYLMLESLSSFEAEEALKEAGVPRKKRAKVLDQQAAVAILQSFLALPEKNRVCL